MGLGFPRRIFEKYPNIKFGENGSRVAPLGQIDLAKLIVAFRNFSKALKKQMVSSYYYYYYYVLAKIPEGFNMQLHVEYLV